jgi:hypothetical protein
MACFASCSPGDPTCNNECFFAHGDAQFGAFATCTISKGCSPIPTSTGRCPSQAIDYPSKPFDVGQLAAKPRLFTIRGFNPVYDMMPCHVDSFQSSGSGVRGQSSFLVKGSHHTATFILFQNSSSTMATTYDLFGTEMHETWKFLYHDDDFVLVFYCGYSLGMQYQGAQLFSTAMDMAIPDHVDEAMHAAWVAAGLDDTVGSYSSFSKVDFVEGSCHNIPSHV